MDNQKDLTPWLIDYLGKERNTRCEFSRQQQFVVFCFYVLNFFLYAVSFLGSGFLPEAHPL